MSPHRERPRRKMSETNAALCAVVLPIIVGVVGMAIAGWVFSDPSAVASAEVKQAPSAIR